MSPRTHTHLSLARVAAAVAGVLAFASVAVGAQPAPTASASGAPAATPSVAGPNFILIIADDMRYDAMGCAGHPFAKTPALDRMANEGVRFANAFVTTSLCGPSRVSFLTGTYARRHGVRGNETGAIDPTLRIFPSLLKQAGYSTAHIGKWHIPALNPDEPRFDHWVGFPGQGVYENPELTIDGQTVRVEGYITDILTDRAVQFLREPHDRPFYMTLAHKAVHEPFTPAPRHRHLYDDLQLPAPTGADPDAWNPRDPAILDWFRTLAALDESVGTILDVLRELHLDRTTLVVFTSDNGYLHLEHGKRDKRLAFEASIRIPLVVWGGPIVQPGRVVQLDALNIDVAPTLLDLAGVHIPDTMQGLSLRPALENRPVRWRTDFLYEYFREPQAPETPTLFAVRSPQWKYVQVPEDPTKDQLYQLQQDPAEVHNLIADESSQPRVREMKRRLRTLQTQLLRAPEAGHQRQR